MGLRTVGQPSVGEVVPFRCFVYLKTGCGASLRSFRVFTPLVAFPRLAFELVFEKVLARAEARARFQELFATLIEVMRRI